MVNATHLVALVKTGALFVNGKLVDRPADKINKAVISKRRTDTPIPRVSTVARRRM